MNRKDFYFKQKVKATELDAAFEDVELAFAAFLRGFNYVGIAAGAAITENAPTNLTVLASGPSIIYDQNQKHIQWTPNQVVNCALDENGAATTVPTVGYERWLSIFAEYDEVLSDPRIDGNGNTVYHARTESFAINVVQGGEASAGTAVRPPLRGDQILLADVKLVYGQTAIVNADIDTTRTQLVYALTGTPLAINARGLQAAMQSMLDTLNGFDAGTVQADAIADSPLSLSSGTIASQTEALLGYVNANTVNVASLLAKLKFAQYGLGGSGNDGDPLNFTEEVNSGGFTRPAIDEIHVPTAGMYLVMLSAQMQNAAATDPLNYGIVLNMGGAPTGVSAVNTRFSGDNTHYISSSAVGIIEVTTPGTDIVQVMAATGVSFIAGSIVLVRLGDAP